MEVVQRLDVLQVDGLKEPQQGCRKLDLNDEGRCACDDGRWFSRDIYSLLIEVDSPSSL